MDKTETIDEAKRLTGPAISTEVTDQDWEAAAGRSATLDQAGRPPSHPAWVATYDPHWMAAEAVTVLAIRTIGTGGQLEGFTSEGSTFKFSQGDLWGMARALRGQSRLAKLAAAHSGGFGVIEVDGRASDYVPTSGDPNALTVLGGGQLVPARLDWT